MPELMLRRFVFSTSITSALSLNLIPPCEGRVGLGATGTLGADDFLVTGGFVLPMRWGLELSGLALDSSLFFQLCGHFSHQARLAAPSNCWPTSWVAAWLAGLYCD